MRAGLAGVRPIAYLAVICLALTACGGDEGPGKVQLYDRAPVPGVPDRTAAVDPSALRPDGAYWGELLSPGDPNPPSLTFHITQAFFADACVQTLGADQCPNGFGTLDDPSLDATATLTDLAAVTVVTADRFNFAITPDELFSLTSGAAPAARAPEGFAYVPYPFLLTVRGGKIVEARQIWLQ